MSRVTIEPASPSPGLCLLWATASLLTVAVCLQAQDPPHWASVAIPIDCTSDCHVGHHDAGGTLTQAADNVNLCQSCHNPAGPHAADLPISNPTKALPGQTGTSHAFDVCAVNTAFSTQVPSDTQMALRLMGADADCTQGYVVCSTCHNQHNSSSTMGGDSRVGNAKMLTAKGSPDGLTAGGTFTGPDGLWYLVEIALGGDETTARFGFSKDNGLSWNDANCRPGAALPDDPWEFTSGCLRANGATPETLDNGVTVTFATGTYVVRDRWEFSAAWPFLRAKLDDAGAGSVMCRDCHGNWDMTAVNTWNGGSVKSHPVRVALPGANSAFHSPPLDGNGLAQDASPSSADGNPTNDFNFDGNSHLQCLTCHGVHFVDSNTQTVDGS